MDQLYQKASEATTSNSEKTLPFSKVPGLVAPSGKLDHEIKAFRDSILKKTVPELKDLLARQNAIITNKKLVSKLPDKGAKVQAKIREIEDLIKSKQKSIDEAANMLENLQLGQEASEKLVDTGEVFLKLKNFLKMSTLFEFSRPKVDTKLLKNGTFQSIKNLN